MKINVVLIAVCIVKICKSEKAATPLDITSWQALKHYFTTVPEQTSFTWDVGPSMTHIVMSDASGNLITEDLINGPVIQSATPADLTYYYYSQRNPVAAVKVKNDNLSPLNGWFKSSRDTYFIIHGWKNSYQSDVNVYTKRAILSKYDVNVIVVDWSPIASRNYLSAKWAVTPVGNFVSDFITSLMVKFNFGTSKISIVGHSLGAHVSGIAGAALKRAYPQGVDHIVGLDPALPLFSISDVNNRLDSTDANYVQVIHTCGGMLGFKAPIGHTDYYPNGGTAQAGCGMDITGACAHSRAYLYFAESVAPVQNNFVSKQCSSYGDYTRGLCNRNPLSTMGGFNVDRGARGWYYLNTNGQPPFAQGNR